MWLFRYPDFPLPPKLGVGGLPVIRFGRTLRGGSQAALTLFFISDKDKPFPPLHSTFREVPMLEIVRNISGWALVAVACIGFALTAVFVLPDIAIRRPRGFGRWYPLPLMAALFIIAYVGYAILPKTTP